MRVLGRLGVKTLLLTNAAGSVNVNYKPGELMVIDDHINFMGVNPLIGPNEDELGPRFFDMSDAYDPSCARSRRRPAGRPASRCARASTSPSPGPPTRRRRRSACARALGADAVGMSTVPEVIAARHMGIRVLGLSCITNMAAGVIKQKLDHREVLEVGEKVRAGPARRAGPRSSQEAAKRT